MPAVCDSNLITTAEPRGSPDETALQAAIDARVASLDSGNYRANNRVVLNAFAEYLSDHRGVTTLEDLEVIDCRRYTQRKRVQDEDDALSAASAHANGPYFTIVRAFLGWCVVDERIDSNTARPNRVKEALPEHHGDHDRQFWSAEAREALLDFVGERAHDALDESADDRDEIEVRIRIPQRISIALRDRSFRLWRTQLLVAGLSTASAAPISGVFSTSSNRLR